MKHLFKLLTFAVALQPPAFAAVGATSDSFITLPTRAPPLEILQGVVTAIDEGHDQISVRLGPDAMEGFKVQDGLIFNAVRFGDHVELTVENIDGAKTIVGLKKQ
jgi:hypothetical protein